MSRWRFCPLSGIMFSIKDKFHDMTYKEAVSVPSRGLWFQLLNTLSISFCCNVSVPSRGLCFQSNNNIKGSNAFIAFPSPLGDYVFNHMYRLLLKENGITFPSPLGDYVFNPTWEQIMALACIVSVPSRGLCFQSRYCGDLNVWLIVSVPSRGLCFQSCQQRG